jgi:hypothetical protein
MNRTTFAAVLLSTLMPLSMASAELQATYVFTAVDSYDIKGDSYEVQVTGIVQGESAPRTVSLTYYPIEAHHTFERCERMVLMAMSRPGQYFLELRQEGHPSTGQLIACKLTRR